MRFLLPLLALCCIVAIARTLPVNFEEVGGYFEGDMDIPVARNGLIHEIFRWPDNEVHYKIDKIFDEAHSIRIKSAMKEIEKVSCIRFYPATEEITDYIHITGKKGKGCSSEVGYQHRSQNLNLEFSPSSNCFVLGTTIHELLHALGFYHQQSASNRDEFVEIFWENIEVGRDSNFDKLDNSTVTDFGIPYDYGSVMHYRSTAFGIDNKITILPFDKNVKIGQRDGMSPSDIKKLNIMYNCSANV